MTIPVVVFLLVYIGMMFGGFPGLALNRTGVALLGAVALIVFGVVSDEAAWGAVDVPTLALLFGLMLVSAQFRLGGFYSHVARSVSALPCAPPVLLAALLVVVAALSAVLTNDIICLAMTPLLIEGCRRRNLNPVPMLLGLACAANIGSAATLIGNPQNMLIGQALEMSFAGYFFDALPPVALGIAATWATIAATYRDRWKLDASPLELDSPEFDTWQTCKGAMVLAGVIAAFLLLPVPREIVALGAGGLLLFSRKTQSVKMLNAVDWQLLVLFVGLFVVNHAFRESGALDQIVGSLRGAGIDISRPVWLFGTAAALSNLVSNVPATMLLLPIATHPLSGVILALSSTFAGNLLVVGSIANIIVVEQARNHGVRVSWTEHARVGIPVTLASLLFAGLWIMWRI